jgi:hypothetical protein
MKIKVKQGVQVVHEGVAYDDEQTVDVPDELAQFWGPLRLVQ